MERNRIHRTATNPNDDWLLHLQSTLNEAHLQITDHVWNDTNNQWNPVDVDLLARVDSLILTVEHMRVHGHAHH